MADINKITIPDSNGTPQTYDLKDSRIEFNGASGEFLASDGTWQTPPGGGSTYTAGTGIDISANDEISTQNIIWRNW